jgi:hypothetical protein
LRDRAERHLAQWRVPDTGHQARIDRLRRDWAAAAPVFAEDRLRASGGMEHLLQWSEAQSLDMQELVVALALEPFADAVDGLAECMCDPFGSMALPLADTAALRAAIGDHAAWALAPDYDSEAGSRRFWYVSAAKQEPRLGDRYAEDGAALESPLDIGRRIKALWQALPPSGVPLSDFLDAHPEHVLAAERVAGLALYPYGEIRDNLIGEDCLPIDMLRCKLAFFGASKFDPKSDRWTRITLCQGAPLADELETVGDDWWLPVFDA